MNNIFEFAKFPAVKNSTSFTNIGGRESATTEFLDHTWFQIALKT